MKHIISTISRCNTDCARWRRLLRALTLGMGMMAAFASPHQLSATPIADTTSFMDESNLVDFSQQCLKVILQVREKRKPEFSGEKESMDAFKKLQVTAKVLQELLLSADKKIPKEAHEALSTRLTECREALKQAGLEL